MERKISAACPSCHLVPSATQGSTVAKRWVGARVRQGCALELMDRGSVLLAPKANPPPVRPSAGALPPLRPISERCGSPGRTAPFCGRGVESEAQAQAEVTQVVEKSANKRKKLDKAV